MDFVPVQAPSQAAVELPREPWTLVLPAVTIGNVGQLAMDLLLTGLNCAHAGHLRAPAVLPVVGRAPEQPSHQASIVTAVEVYVLQERESPLVLIQQRAPVIRGQAQKHAEAVVGWAASHGCREILLLASANAAGRIDDQLRADETNSPLSSRLRFAATSAALHGSRLAWKAREECGWSSLENQDARGWAPGDLDVVEHDRLHGVHRLAAFLPTSRKGAFVRSILTVCEDQALPLTVLLQFAHEGDNSSDARILASAVAILLKLESRIHGNSASLNNGHQLVSKDEDTLLHLLSSWKIPESWLHNTVPPTGLY